MLTQQRESNRQSISTSLNFNMAVVALAPLKLYVDISRLALVLVPNMF